MQPTAFESASRRAFLVAKLNIFLTQPLHKMVTQLQILRSFGRSNGESNAFLSLKTRPRFQTGIQESTEVWINSLPTLQEATCASMLALKVTSTETNAAITTVFSWKISIENLEFLRWLSDRETPRIVLNWLSLSALELFSA